MSTKFNRHTSISKPEKCSFTLLFDILLALLSSISKPVKCSFALLFAWYFASFVDCSSLGYVRRFRVIVSRRNSNSWFVSWTVHWICGITPPRVTTRLQLLDLKWFIWLRGRQNIYRTGVLQSIILYKRGIFWNLFSCRVFTFRIQDNKATFVVLGANRRTMQQWLSGSHSAVFCFATSPYIHIVFMLPFFTNDVTS